MKSKMDGNQATPEEREAAKESVSSTPTLSGRLRVLAARCEEEPVTLGVLLAASEGGVRPVGDSAGAAFPVAVPIPMLSSLFGLGSV